MDVFMKLIELCQSFSEGNLEIHDFQSRIRLLPYPDGCSRQFYNILHNAVNRLEEIIFCNEKSEHTALGTEVAETLIEEAELEARRMQNMGIDKQ